METVMSFLPLKDSTVGSDNMAEPRSIDIDGQGDKICEPKDANLSEIISDMKNSLSQDSDSVVVDIQMRDESRHSKNESTISLKNTLHGETCDNKEQEKVIGGASKINGLIVDSVPNVHKINTITQPHSESLCLDSSSLSDISNSSSTSQSGTLLIPKQTTSSSNIVSHGATTESDLIVADRDTCTLSSVNEPFDKDEIISEIKSTSAESLELNGIVSEIKSTNAESFELNGIVSEIKSTSAESLELNEIVSEIKSTSAESLELNGIVSEIKSTSAESFELNEIVSEIKSTSADSFDNTSEMKSTSAESFEEDEIISGIKSTSAEAFELNEIVSEMKSSSAESFEDSDNTSEMKSASAEAFELNEIVTEMKSACAETFEKDEIISEIKSVSDESFEEKNSTYDVSPNSPDISSNAPVMCSQECSQQISNMESGGEPMYDDNSSQTDYEQDHERSAANHLTQDNEDVEDIQADGHEQMAQIENCFTISEADMDYSVTESEMATEADESAQLNDVDEMTFSVEKSDPVRLSDSCNILSNNCDKTDQIQTSSSPLQDVISVDESASVDDVCQDIASPGPDEDTCNIKIAESRSMGGDFTDYSGSNEVICLEESDTEQESASTEHNVNLKELDSDNNLTLVVNNYSEQPNQECSTEDSIRDQYTAEDFSDNLDNVTSAEIEHESQEAKSGQQGDQNNHDIDMKMNRPSIEKETCAFDQSCEQMNCHPYNCASDKSTKTPAGGHESYLCVAQTSDKKTEDEVSVVENKESEINKTCASLCETDKTINNKLCDSEHSNILKSEQSEKCERQHFGSCKEKQSFVKTDNVLDKKEIVDNKLEVKDVCTDPRVGHGNKVTEEEQKLGDKNEIDKAESVDEDDEVLFVDEAGDIKSAHFSDEKHNFTNILHTSKVDYGGIDSIVIDENEYSDSTKSITEPLSKSEKLINKQDEHNVEVTATLVNIDEQMEVSSVDSGRKRMHKENVDDDASVSKRSRLDPKVNKLEDQSKKPIEAPPSEILDSDDDVILEEEAPMVAAVSEDTVKAVKAKDDNMIVLTSEALQNLITIRVKAFLKSQKQTNLENLTLRTKGMQSASNLWRETAKHLEKSISRLVDMNQKLEKNKKKLQQQELLYSFLQLESRSVGIQVGGEKQNSFRPVVNGTYNKMPETPPTSVGVNISRPASFNSSTSQTPQPNRHQIQSSPSSNQALRSPALVTQPPTQRMQNRPGRPVASYPPLPNPAPQRSALTLPGRMLQSQLARPPISQQSLNNAVPLIDLTDDDDNTRKIDIRTPQYTASQPGTPNLPKNVMGGKTLGNSNMKPYSSNGQILHSPASGSQHPSYQLVTTPNPAPNLGMNPGSRPAQHNTSPGSNLSATRRNLPQNSTQSVPSSKPVSHSLPPSFHISNKHPAPLPTGMDAGNAPASAKRRPPKPGLKISRVSQGIVLSWNMPPLLNVEKITSYQLFAYQESDSTIPKSSLWKKVGDVKALPLPMACTLTQFQEGNKYHFAVRAVDQYGRWGSYSDPSSIFLGSKT